MEQLDPDHRRRGRLRHGAQGPGRTRDPGPWQPGLIQTLLEHDLIDEYRLWIFPVVVGGGKRFFGDGTSPGALKLVNSKVSSTGVTINTYEPAGDIEIGDTDFEEPSEAELARRKRLVDASYSPSGRLLHAA